MNNLLKCRNCGKHYWELKSSATYTGFCTERCLVEKARALGWRRKDGDYAQLLTLRKAGEIGDVRVSKEVKRDDKN